MTWALVIWVQFLRDLKESIDSLDTFNCLLEVHGMKWHRYETASCCCKLGTYSEKGHSQESVVEPGFGIDLVVFKLVHAAAGASICTDERWFVRKYIAMLAQDYVQVHAVDEHRSM